MHIEDFSGKADFALFGEDYVKYSNYLEKGTIVMLEGAFKTRYNSDLHQFYITKLHLLETVKKTLTKEIKLELHPTEIDENFIQFFENNIKNNPGKTNLKFICKDEDFQLKIHLNTLMAGFTMNDDMASFLNDKQGIKVSVLTL